MTLQGLANLHGALRGSRWLVRKTSAIPVAGRQANEFSFGIRFTKLARAAYNFIELAECFALLIDQQFRVTHDIDEQDVRDLQSQLCHFFARHSQANLLLVSDEHGKNFHGVVPAGDPNL